MKLSEFILKHIDTLQIDNINSFDPGLVDCYHDDDLTNQQVVDAAHKYGTFIDCSDFIQKDYVIAHNVSSYITVKQVRDLLKQADFQQGEGVSDNDVLEAFAEIDDGDFHLFDGVRLEIYSEYSNHYVNITYEDLKQSLCDHKNTNTDVYHAECPKCGFVVPF